MPGTGHKGQKCLPIPHAPTLLIKVLPSWHNCHPKTLHPNTTILAVRISTWILRADYSTWFLDFKLFEVKDNVWEASKMEFFLYELWLCKDHTPGIRYICFYTSERKRIRGNFGVCRSRWQSEKRRFEQKTWVRGRVEALLSLRLHWSKA